MKTYDTWKATNPQDEWLGPDPDDETDADPEPAYPITVQPTRKFMETSVEKPVDKPKNNGSEVLEQVVIGGDLSRLTPQQRVKYYQDVCASLGLNPLTKPFAYLHLNGRTVLYAQRDCTDQLRSLKGISIKIVETQTVDGIHIVRAQATDRAGRVDESTGAVSVAGLKGEALCNAIMKSETKAKRRVTLSICGLGLMDETEIATGPGAHPEGYPEVTPPAPKRGDFKAPTPPPQGVYDVETGEVVETEPTEEQKAEWQKIASYEAWANATIRRLDAAVDIAKIDDWLARNEAKLAEIHALAPDVSMAVIGAAEARKRALGYAGA